LPGFIGLVPPPALDKNETFIFEINLDYDRSHFYCQEEIKASSLKKD